MSANKSDLGKNIRELRKEKNETLHQVSKGTDIDSPMLSKIERGERLPTLDQIKRIAKYYKIDESEFRVKLTAERIIKEYGVSDITYDAVMLVGEEIALYKRKKLKAK